MPRCPAVAGSVQQVELHSHSCVPTDFEQLLRLEPGNKQALNELQKLQSVRTDILTGSQESLTEIRLCRDCCAAAQFSLGDLEDTTRMKLFGYMSN